MSRNPRANSMDDQGANKERRRLIYRGRVQGVGFRYTTARIAKRFPVTGYVRNQADGTVEIVIEGSGQDLDSLIAEIGVAFSGYIDACTPQQPPIGENFAGFEIRR